MSYFNDPVHHCNDRSDEVMVGSADSGGPEDWRCEMDPGHQGVHAGQDYGFWVTWTDENRLPHIMPNGWEPEDQWAPGYEDKVSYAAGPRYNPRVHI